MNSLTEFSGEKVSKGKKLMNSLTEYSVKNCQKKKDSLTEHSRQIKKQIEVERG